MAKNCLKMKSAKTEFLIIGTRQQLAKLQYSSINICRRCVKNLVVFFYSKMKMIDHVQPVIRVCFGKLKHITSDFANSSPVK